MDKHRSFHSYLAFDLSLSQHSHIISVQIWVTSPLFVTCSKLLSSHQQENECLWCLKPTLLQLTFYWVQGALSVFTSKWTPQSCYPKSIRLKPTFCRVQGGYNLFVSKWTPQSCYPKSTRLKPTFCWVQGGYNLFVSKWTPQSTKILKCFHFVSTQQLLSPSLNLSI